jgi:DNA primase
LRQWGQASAPVRAFAPSRPTSRRPGPLSKGTANLLDRAVWLLLHRSEIWAQLDGEAHDILAAQAAPYDHFFSCVERCLHEHGPLAPSAMLAELREGCVQDTSSVTVLSRIAGFHDPEPDSDVAHELSLVIAKLRLQAVDDELKLLFDSGVQSPDAQRRSRELMDARKRLKA